MKTARWVAALLVLCLGPAARANDLEEALRREWLGTYVLVRLPVQSNCNSLYTNNQVLPGRLLSDGVHRFEGGELGHVAKVDLKRARVDLLIELVEPLRVDFTDGPFTLASHAFCRAELLFPLERAQVKRRDVDAVRTVVREVLDPHATENEARAAESYNGRVVDPLPEDHEQTWNEYTRYKVGQAVEHAGDELERLRRKARYENDPEHALGFAEGLGRYHTLPDECLALAEATPSYYSGSPPSEYDKDQKRDWQEGYDDGAKAAFYTALLPRLSSCLVAVP